MPSNSFDGRTLRKAAKKLDELRRPLHGGLLVRAWVWRALLAGLSVFLVPRALVERIATSGSAPAASAAELGMSVTANVTISGLNSVRRAYEFSSGVDDWVRERQYREALGLLNRLIARSPEVQDLTRAHELIEQARDLDERRSQIWSSGIRDYRSSGVVPPAIDTPRVRTYDGGSHDEWMAAALRDPESQRWMSWFQQLAEMAQDRGSRLNEAGELLNNLNDWPGRTPA